MKKIKYIFTLLSAIFILAACNHEPAVLNLTITPENSDVFAGEEVTFVIDGQYEFLTFYDGFRKKYENYPFDNGIVVDLADDETTFSQMYTDTNGVVTAIFVATSYGEWGNEEIEEIFEFPININDNRTDLQSVRIRYNNGSKTVSGKAELDNENAVITLEIEPESDLTNISIMITPLNDYQTLKYNGANWVDRTELDFTSSDPKITVIAANGETTRDFSFEIVFI